MLVGDIPSLKPRIIGALAKPKLQGSRSFCPFMDATDRKIKVITKCFERCFIT